MPDFLNYLADHISEKYGDSLKEITVVFPSRRAGLFFKNILREKAKKVNWVPEVISIMDFISKYSGIKIENNLVLNFTLYEIYKKYFHSEEFDKYYHWGNIIINDFDTIDKYLAESDKIFRDITNIKEIEERFPVELSEEYINFWKNLKSDETEEKKEFRQIWKNLGLIYRDFRKISLTRKTGYEGLAYKFLYENIKSGNSKIDRRKIIFAGLNLITPSELGIISELIKENKCEIHFDCDKYYFEDKNQEAGYHIRKSAGKIKQIITELESDINEILFINQSDELTGGTKNINLINAPAQSGMVKSFGNDLHDFLKDNTSNERTAVVLPDESLLIQVLYSVPEEVKEFNITMGYPFNASLLHSFLVLLKELHFSCRVRNGKTEFYFPVLRKLFLHPYIKFSDTKLTYEMINRFTAGNIIYFDPDKNDTFNEILNKSDSGIPAIYKKILNYTADNKQFHNHLTELIKSVYDRIENSKTEDDTYKKFQFEFLYYFHINFNLLCRYIEKHKIEINPNAFWKLLIEISSGIRIPFSGEPLRGMQIMGLLETRCLDFDNLFILSMNEGIFPKSSADLSFIPLIVRKYFKLPTFEDDDSVYAYYFYRLIQKAKNIFLFYDSETEKSSKGKSRFLLQIEKELIKINPSINFTEKNTSPGVVPVKILPIEIPKSEAVMDKINKIDRLSASELITAITCKLKFYLKHVIRLKEPDETEEEFQGATFGSIFHTLMQSLYENYTGKTVTADDIKGLIIKIEKDFDSTFDNVLKKVSEKEKRIISLEQSPKNSMYKYVISKLVLSTLKYDLEYTPFNIISLEKKFSKPYEINTGKGIKKINLEGYIDRIDVKDGITRIIDYKTGSSYYKELKDDLSFFDEIITKTDYKDSFQTLFYAFNHINNTEQKYKPVIYYVNEKNKMVRDIKSTHLSKDDYDNFRTRLNIILTGIFNHDSSFTQTENPENCSYCPFRDLCYRK